jgi:hypothetical protein
MACSKGVNMVYGSTGLHEQIKSTAAYRGHMLSECSQIPRVMVHWRGPTLL